jgi:hypothetical protein
MQLASKLAELVRACFTGIWVESHEHLDAMTEIAQLCRQEGWRPRGVSDETYETGAIESFHARAADLVGSAITNTTRVTRKHPNDIRSKRRSVE